MVQRTIRLGLGPVPPVYSTGHGQSEVDLMSTFFMLSFASTYSMI